MSYKTILVTHLLAAHILQLASAINNTTVSDDIGPEITFDAIAEVDEFDIVHHHEVRGPQLLRFTQVHPSLFSVSFVGSNDLFQHLDWSEESGGHWDLAIDTLVAYLQELDPTLAIDRSFLAVEYQDESNLLLRRSDEPGVPFEPAAILGALGAHQVFVEAVDSVSSAIDEAGTTSVEDCIASAADAADQAAPSESFGQRTKKTFRRAVAHVTSPRGRWITATVVAGVALAVLYSKYNVPAEV